MLDAGLRRKFVQGFLNGLLDRTRANMNLERMLNTVPTPVDVWLMDLADGDAIRMRSTVFGDEVEVLQPWTRIADHRVIQEPFRPITVITIDLAELRRRLLQV